MQLQIGPDVVGSYRRLAYSPWHAIAEFVDNATQSYFDHEVELKKEYAREGTKLTIRVVYEDGLLRIVDNAMGMSYEELEHALHLASPPANPTGRCRYGMGLKTAAFWMGNEWTVKTKRLGETQEHQATVSLERLMRGDTGVDYKQASDVAADRHYTIIEVRGHNRVFKGRTLGKIADYLRSMYRQDLRNGILDLEWRGQRLTWDEPELLCGTGGLPFRKEYEFNVGGRRVWGWVGILARGSRAQAGFCVLQCGRLIKGWPEAWRPRELYGQELGSNDLVNQRLIGEINLDGFEVSHTKDDILWLGDEEEQVERGLLEQCSDYKRHAQDYRKGTSDGRGPSEAAKNTAVDELKRELESPEMVDQITMVTVLPREAVDEVFDAVVKSVSRRQETLRATVGDLVILVYVDDLSPNDPYVACEPATDTVTVVVNQSHPHWKTLDNREVLNYLRHCVYDAVAEWQAGSKLSRIDPHTIRLFKDRLLRVPFEVEQHEPFPVEGTLPS